MSITHRDGHCDLVLTVNGTCGVPREWFVRVEPYVLDKKCNS